MISEFVILSLKALADIIQRHYTWSWVQFRKRKCQDTVVHKMAEANKGINKSPYPWISDSVFSGWQRCATKADAARLIVRDVILVTVTEDDRARAPRLKGDIGELPPIGSLSQHEKLLASSIGAGRVTGAHWPVCCERLTTLVFIHGRGTEADELIEGGELQGCLLSSVAKEAQQPFAEAVADWNTLIEHIRQRKHSGEGVNLFHCRVCDKLYGSYSEA